MEVLIYGGGAVGLGIAGCLLKSQVSIDILARKDTVLALQKNGLKRTGIFGDFYAESSSFGSFSSLGQCPQKHYDCILVCTKSFDSSKAAKDIAEHRRLLGENTKIVLFQNGWGNAEKFIAFFNEKSVYSARVITGFSRPEPDHITVTVHADSIHIGSLFGADISGLENLSSAINNGGIPCITTETIEKDLWAKMLYNCALNPLGAILDVPYGKLAEYDYSRKIMDCIIEEVFEVMARAGHKTHCQTARDFLEFFYSRLVPDTARHKSSMLQDISAKKPTEIEALNGAVIELAVKFQIPTPYNLVVYNMIKFIEAKNL